MLNLIIDRKIIYTRSLRALLLITLTLALTNCSDEVGSDGNNSSSGDNLESASMPYRVRVTIINSGEHDGIMSGDFAQNTVKVSNIEEHIFLSTSSNDKSSITISVLSNNSRAFGRELNIEDSKYMDGEQYNIGFLHEGRTFYARSGTIKLDKEYSGTEISNFLGYFDVLMVYIHSDGSEDLVPLEGSIEGESYTSCLIPGSGAAGSGSTDSGWMETSIDRVPGCDF